MNTTNVNAIRSLEDLIASAFEKVHSLKVASIKPTESGLGYFRIEYEYVNSRGKLETDIVGYPASAVLGLIRLYYERLNLREIEA